MSDRKLILFIAMSLDGYIADENDNLDFLSVVESPGEDYGYSAFVNTVDTVIMGRKTYDKVLSFGIDFPHKDKTCYVLSRSKTGNDGNVEFYNGSLKTLIATLRTQPGKDIFCDGGGETVFEMMREKLFDKLVISIIPHLVGNGRRLFIDGRPGQGLKLVDSKIFPSGLVQLSYENKTA